MWRQAAGPKQVRAIINTFVYYLMCFIVVLMLPTVAILAAAFSYNEQITVISLSLRSQLKPFFGVGDDDCVIKKDVDDGL